MWYIYANGILLSHKNKIMSFASTWMDLEMIILSEVRERQISYDITCMWNPKKKGTNELVYRIEIELDIDISIYRYRQ